MIDLNKNFNTTKNENIPELKPGDQVSVHVRIKEGDRERIQEFKGTVIRYARVAIMPISPFAGPPPMALAWNVLSCCFRPGSIKWWWSAIPMFAGRNCTSCVG